MIEKCLNSCLQQSYRPLEIIVVDNNSTDNSMTIVERLKRQHGDLITALSCPTPGAGVARNLGYRQAKGDYIQWLDADDELDENKIHLQVAALEKDKSFDIAYGSWDLRVYTDGKLFGNLRINAPRYEDVLLELLINNWRPPNCYLLRRSMADRLHAWEGWTPTERVLQDRRYFTFAALFGARFLAVPSAWAVYNRWSSQQLSSATSLAARGPVLKRMCQDLKTCHSRQPYVTLNKSHEFLIDLSKEAWARQPADPAHLKKSELAVLKALQDPNTYKGYLPADTPLLLEQFAPLIVLALCKAEPSAERLDAILEIPPLTLLHQNPVPHDRIEPSMASLPVFCEYRLPVLRILTELCQKGYLAQVP